MAKFGGSDMGLYGEEQFLYTKMKDMSTEERKLFLMQYSFLKKDRNIALILSILFGHLGADQYYIGETRTGLLKLLLTFLSLLFYFIFPIFVMIITLCVLGFFVIINWTTIQEETDTYNKNLGNNLRTFIMKLNEEKSNSK
jgi:TM2 domain-containing membrane protein YozV